MKKIIFLSLFILCACSDDKENKKTDQVIDYPDYSGVYSFETLGGSLSEIDCFIDDQRVESRIFGSITDTLEIYQDQNILTMESERDISLSLTIVSDSGISSVLRQVNGVYDHFTFIREVEAYRDGNPNLLTITYTWNGSFTQNGIQGIYTYREKELETGLSCFNYDQDGEFIGDKLF